MIANFLVIANKRCGTSWLNKNLAEHPDIFMTEKKGVHFFDQHYEKGVSFYEKYFIKAENEKWRGETEHSYFWDDRVPQRIYKFLGVIPLILSLRQPVERAYSYFQLQNRDKETADYDFESVFMKALEENHPMIAWGFYGRQLKKYLQYFSLEKLHIIKFENIKTNPKKTIQSVYSFLGVNSDFVPPLLNKKWTPATNLPSEISSLKREILYTSSTAVFVRKNLRRIGFRGVRVYRKFSPPALGKALKKRLTSYYDDDINLLGKLTGMDFSLWLSSSL